MKNTKLEAKIETSEIRSAEELAGLEESWSAVTGNAPLRSQAWLLGWWKHFGAAPKQLRVLLFHETTETSGQDRQLVGIAPLYIDSVGRRTVYRMLGDTGDVCTDHTTWFCMPGYEQAVGRAVARYFNEKSSSADGWHRLHLSSIDDGDDALNTTLARMEETCLIQRKSVVSCWGIDLPETWDDYLGMLSKSHRKRCRRLVRQFFDTERVVVHEATQDNFEDVWRMFLNLHAMRWGDNARPDGSFSSRRFADFHAEVSRSLFDQGQVRLCYLTCDDQPVAAEYQLIGPDVLYAYQSGMAENVEGVQPGNLSLIATIQYCLDHGLNRLDLLRGDEPYKAHWRATGEPCHDVRVWPRGLLGQMEMGYFGFREVASKLLKSRLTTASKEG